MPNYEHYTLGVQLDGGRGERGQREEVCHVLFRKMKKGVLILTKKMP